MTHKRNLQAHSGGSFGSAFRSRVIPEERSEIRNPGEYCGSMGFRIPARALLHEDWPGRRGKMDGFQPYPVNTFIPATHHGPPTGLDA